MTKPTAKFYNTQILIISIFFMFVLLLGGCSGSSADAYGSKGTTAAREVENGLTVHFIDVGQGDSILASSQGRYMLIDAGENDQADTVISYLKNEGVTELDYVIGTHPHSDHIGGLDKVIDTFSVDKVILPPIEHTTRTFEDVLDSIAAKGLKITKPVPGDSYNLGGASFTILSPLKDYGDDLNNWSVGIRLSYRDNSFIMCGDAETRAEEDIAASGAVLKADVLKAGHHGSRTSTSDTFLRRVSPQWVVVQCGKGNSYGHPHKETMEKLTGAGCQVLRTDQEGTVIAYSDGNSIIWNADSGLAGDTRAETDDTGQTAGSTGQTEGNSGQTAGSYVLNTNTGRFHRPDCASVTRMKPENRQDVTDTRDELMQMGYEPCKQCNP